MSEQENNPVEAILQRIQAVTGVSTDAALARVFGVSPPTISGWRARRAVPYRKLHELAEERELSLDYLLFGRHPDAVSLPVLSLIGAHLEQAAKERGYDEWSAALRYWYAGLIYNRLKTSGELALVQPDDIHRECEFLIDVLQTQGRARTTAELLDPYSDAELAEPKTKRRRRNRG